MSDDYDPDDHVYDLEDVCTRLDSIEAAVTANHPGIWIGWGLAIGLAIFVWISDMWFSKTRISWWYGVSTNQVTIEKKPPDCDFFHAPLGDKSCHYDSQVSAIQVKTDKSYPARYPVAYVSFDEGKTWAVDDAVPRTNPRVMVSWEKKED